ncbi:alanine/glycine:cation symporter family protein [Desulfitobacterium chlororespirans]|uniref:Alanine or glycine:cation symporter, AGCS family n=1 Tax=Desulfitobacterium chlororespirans DSM 11544 TaxID=1121395 RepID=A0A1M7RUY3_9FIRM|nr:sodium:alanine symporter family protein [Desulfitobacterium chlororespirans]SHN49812.1 alanine or glycine:cation symporter, AGCS family [Desulfitobacterium chlororespirans DSM 11544]
MEWFSNLVVSINAVLWDVFLILLLCGVGIYFTILTKGVQFRLFKQSFKLTFGSITLRGNAASDKEGMTSFQSLITSVSAQIGTGNLAGVATAMVSGGPGAVFWMWLSAILGMATIYAEATLAQRYKTTKNGELVGGPVYYIRAAIKGRTGRVVAAVFALLLIMALGFMGNMVQANSVGGAMETAFGIPSEIIGIGLALICLLVFLGGVKRIVAVAEKVVPFMAVFFTLASFVVIGANFSNIIPAFHDIFVGAFYPQAVLGGVLGVSVQQAIRFGIARGLFTHEAGMGSTPHAHALARVKDPCDQGLVAMMGVFIDTIVLLPLTVLAILTSGVLGSADANGEFVTGIQLTQAAYAQVFGQFGYVIIAICVLFFAFATIMGWYFFGLANVKYLFGKKAVPFYAILVAVFVGVGCALKVDLVWNLADLFNGLMVIPNILALIILGGVVARLTKNWGSRS